MECRLCGSQSLELCYSFGQTFIGDTFSNAANSDEIRYGYDIWACTECCHIQSFDVVDPGILFGSSYTYKPGYSKGLESDFMRYVQVIKDRGYIRDKAKVVDIGSNDGLFLRCIKEIVNCDVVGVEPAAGPREFAISNGISTISGFFDSQSAEKIIEHHGEKVDLASANNVFAHCDDLGRFAENVSRILVDGGIFTFEVSYLLRILERDLIGAYFHEHLSHHSVTCMSLFLKRHGLQIIDAFETSSQGGSVVMIAEKSSEEKDISAEAKSLISEEVEAGLTSLGVVDLVKLSFSRAKENYMKALASLPTGSRIEIFGAARSLTTFDRVFDITKGVTRIYDDNVEKIGKYYPGTEALVAPTSEIITDKPDCLIIAAWVPTEKVIEKIRRETSVKYVIRLLDPICLIEISR